MTMNIETSEILDAIRLSFGELENNSELFSACDLMTAMDCSRSRVTQIINRCIRAGTMALAGTREEYRIDGNRCKVPVYKVIK